ncbi:hypothetical protein AVEN_14965-1 [Araneus ventricosus]|uniref:DUF4817 domain-containing protein n=1 Tax=Araneus ventricosus TaxID=182803 RepID=A0A4Y2FC91_ARAVE|nr:hypothetical protein AVEN_14965-1 [Araneus ventricosus]
MSVKGKTSGRSRVSAENVERIRRTYEGSPRKSTYEGSRATEKCMACSKKEAENETVRNSTCAAIETGTVRQTYELCLCRRAWRMKQWLIVSFLAMNQPST